MMPMDWPGSGELSAGTTSKKQQHKYTGRNELHRLASIRKSSLLHKAS
jgi:hypothetical protein